MTHFLDRIYTELNTRRILDDGKDIILDNKSFYLVVLPIKEVFKVMVFQDHLVYQLGMYPAIAGPRSKGVVARVKKISKHMLNTYNHSSYASRLALLTLKDPNDVIKIGLDKGNVMGWIRGFEIGKHVHGLPREKEKKIKSLSNRSKGLYEFLGLE